MNIAFFADNFYPELSGIADTIKATGQELAKRGHRVTYFVPSYSKKNYAASGLEMKEVSLGENIHIHRMPSVPYPTGTQQGRAAIPNVFRGLMGEKFDMVHTNSFWGPGIDALCLSKTQRTPLVGTNHTLIESFIEYSPVKNDTVARLLKSYVVGYYNQCDMVTAPSDFLIEDMRQAGLKASAQSISNPIEDLFFKPRTSKEQLKNELTLSPFTFLYTGRISAEKNIGVLLDAFIAFTKKHTDISLVLIGNGSLRSAYEKKINALGLEKNILFKGPFLGDSKPLLYDYYHASDAFVMPSTSETQSMSTLQAMAAELPIIAADAGALPEITRGRGLLFDPSSSESLLEQLEKIYSDSTLAHEFVSAGKSYAKQYSVATIADAWEKLYDSQIQHGNTNH